MRIFAKKAFCFEKREIKDGLVEVVSKFEVKPKIFTDAPDWITDDDMFKWARADGDIEIMETVKEEKDTEKTADKTKPSNKAAEKAERELLASITE